VSIQIFVGILKKTGRKEIRGEGKNVKRSEKMEGKMILNFFSTEK